MFIALCLQYLLSVAFICAQV